MRSFFARVLAPLVCTGILLAPGLASARISDSTTGLGATGQAAGLSTSCSGQPATTCVATLLGRVFSVLFGFLGILLLGYILYGGFVWMTAGGDPKAVGQAQDIIRNAVIGLVIIASSFAVSTFVIREVKQISTLGSGTDSAGQTGVGTDAAGNGDPSLNQLIDGSLRACCYAGSTPVLECTRDCQANPAAFGLTAPATEDQCLTPCAPGNRVCPGNPPAPASGQTTCRPGATTITGNQAQGTGTPQATYNAVEFCRQLDVEAASLNPTRDACRICANGCLSEICGTNGGNGRMPAGMGGNFPVINSQGNANIARQRCENTVCAPQCVLGY